jgi:hypothetical protein
MMTPAKLLSAALVAAALTTPAIARTNHLSRRHHADVTATSDARDMNGGDCIRAPAVGAYATQPWDNGPPPCEPSWYNYN